MKKYNIFINNLMLEGVSKFQSETIDKIMSYLYDNTDIMYFQYDEKFVIKKPNEILEGTLYLMDDGRALRINFEGDILHSLDLWQLFKFDNQTIMNHPFYTMEPNTNDVDDYLDDIVDFINEDFSLNESDNDTNVEFKKADDEVVKFKSLKLNKAVLNNDLDVFDAINMYVRQVAYGVSNSLIISGDAGVGKTSEVTEILDDTRLEYEFFKGDITKSGLYETLFVNNGKLLVFDDCDAVFQDTDSVNLLKSALDTKKNREISRILKTHYDSKGLTYKEMIDKYNKDKKLPKQFVYNGRCIFITNIDGDKMDKALVSRSLHVDVKLTRDEIIERLKRITEKIYPRIPNSTKEETIEFVDFMTKGYKSKFPLSIRTIIHALNIRVSNDFMIDIDGEKVPAWQMLVKQFLIEK